jgi:glycosyltransferase involved in cell wall biosynthesis
VPRAATVSEPTSVLAVAHSAGAGVRARALLEGFPSARVVTPAADARGIAATALLVIRSRSRVLYLVDVGRTTAPAAVVGRLTGKRVIVDTGDATFALARSLGDRSRIGLAVVGAGEQLALRSAHQIVVRGRAHAARVPGPAVHIPDLAPREAAPMDSGELRAELGLDGAFVAGLVGSLILSPRLGISYGWDLVEALAHTDQAMVALIVGDGSGLEALRERAAELGVADRCRFVGRVPSDRVGPYVCAMDVGISTQTNDEVGQVRTAAKLPLYLACGRPVLASHVGEAARLLGPHGWTIPYRGVVDRGYPGRLAAALEAWRQDPDGAEARGALALRLAADEFDAAVLRGRLRTLIAAG